MKRLYNKNEQLNDDGMKVQKKVADHVRKVIQRLASQGYSLIDVEHCIVRAAAFEATMARLHRLAK